jgi:phenylacetate-CoA ligase
LRHTHWNQWQVEDYQNKKLRAIVKYAYENVKFYHEKLDHTGLKPDDIKTVSDLKKLPMVKRDELQNSSEQLISKQFRIDRLKSVSTSGSSGKPLMTYLTKTEDEFRKAKLLRPHVVCGQKPWDKWVLIEAIQNMDHVGQLQRLFNFYTPVFVSVFDDPTKQTWQIGKLKPDVLDGHSNSLFLVSQEVEEKGLTTIRPRFIMGGAEQIDASNRKTIERNFDAPFYDQYASEEFQMIAWQCPERDEYHIDADSLVLQFIDEAGEEVAPGERGELVCTSLFNRAMPFLRYKLGDLAAFPY